MKMLLKSTVNISCFLAAFFCNKKVNGQFTIVEFCRFLPVCCAQKHGTSKSLSGFERLLIFVKTGTSNENSVRISSELSPKNNPYLACTYCYDPCVKLHYQSDREVLPKSIYWLLTVHLKPVKNNREVLAEYRKSWIF